MNGPVGGSGILDLARDVLHFLLALPPQDSAFAARVDDLHFVEIVSFWVIGLALFGFTGYCLVRYAHHGPEDLPVRTPRVTAPLWMEVAFVAVLLSMFLGWWVVGFVQWTDTQAVHDDAYEVYVTGKQWMWKFDYPEGRTTAGVLYVPQGRNVRLLLTSRDVIHSFFVPDFRIKQDAVPGRWLSVGFLSEAVGPHDVLCAEFCGPGHSRMWGRVVVLPPDRFDRWLETGRVPEEAAGPVGEPSVTQPAPRPAEGTPPGSSLARQGAEVAASRGCFGCHSTDGTVVLAPTWRNLWGRTERLQDGDSVRVDAAYITESMMDPLARVVAGFDPIMPSYQGQITPRESAAIIEYIRTLSQGGGEGR